MLLHGANGRFVRVRFCGGKSGGAFRRDSPVIEHAWDMTDLRRLDLLHAAQNQVVVLRAFEAEAESAHTSCQLSSVNAQMGDVVLRGEKVGVPVRLEIGIATAAPFIEFVFVAIEELQLRITI